MCPKTPVANAGYLPRAVKAWLPSFPSLRRPRSPRYQRLLEFNRSLELIADPGALYASVAERIGELFPVDRQVVLALDPPQRAYRPVYSVGFEDGPLDGLIVPRWGRLAQWLSVNESGLLVEPGHGPFEYLADDERALLQRFGIRLCQPLISLNRLTGIILLGITDAKAARRWSPSEQELELLQLIGLEAGLAFENSRLAQDNRQRVRKLDRAESLAAAGQLAAGLAHEVRNPLTSIRSSVQYVLNSMPEADAKRELLEEVVAEVDRIDQIVDGLLALTRDQRLEPEPTEVTGLLQRALVLVRAQLSERDIQLTTEIDCPRSTVDADADQLQRVLINLLTNAIQAMPQGGTLTVLARVADAQPGSQPERELVEIRVCDTGVGIRGEDLERVFDPFFTTKREGTGLGLSICHRIVEQHQGRIRLQSTPGVGTQAVVQLPLLPAHLDAEPGNES
jgi:signal transduction histidine kinase